MQIVSFRVERWNVPWNEYPKSFQHLERRGIVKTITEWISHFAAVPLLSCQQVLIPNGGEPSL